MYPVFVVCQVHKVLNQLPPYAPVTEVGQYIHLLNFGHQSSMVQQGLHVATGETNRLIIRFDEYVINSWVG